MNVLAIETSCDETAAAIVERSADHIRVLANTVSSQTSLHSQWGGVVPNLASREHIKNIVPVIRETLTRAHLKPQDIDLIAVTQGPGLMPALLIGVTAGKTLSLIWQKPLIGIHHLEGHIYANFVDKSQNLSEIFPLVALVVSGGHTQLILMRKHFDYQILGETQDDAAGEAFDKVAKLLGLLYPGGPEIAKRANAFCNSNFQTHAPTINHQLPTTNHLFPRPMISSGDYNFSFSGLKTAVLYFLKKHEDEMQDKNFVDRVCYEFQEAVTDVLAAKSEKALREFHPQTFIIAGGVSANIRLREKLQTMTARLNDENQFTKNKIIFLMPELSYSLDNAAMIGVAAALRYELMNEKEKNKLQCNWKNLEPDANLPLSSI